MAYPISDTYSQILNLYKDRSRWTQQYYQRDVNGKECPWAEGYSFCAIGAIQHFTYDMGSSMNHAALCCLQRVSEHLYGEHIQVVNDGEGGYEKVIKALEFARDLWEGRSPIIDHYGMSISDLLLERKAE